MAVAYREHPLHPALAPFAEAAWSVRAEAGEPGQPHRILPDGCIDLIVRAGGEPFVAGPMTRPALGALGPGEVVHGVRFRPGLAPSLLGVAAHELLDLDVPLAALWSAGHGEGDLQSVLLARLGAARRADALVARAVARLTQDPATGVRALAAETAVSERQLRRRFHDAVGYGPKRLARVLRLQRLVHEGRRRPAASGAELAFAAGYADQPHMTREVRALAGTGPAALVAERVRSVQDAESVPRQGA